MALDAAPATTLHGAERGHQSRSQRETDHRGAGRGEGVTGVPVLGVTLVAEVEPPQKAPNELPAISPMASLQRRDVAIWVLTMPRPTATSSRNQDLLNATSPAQAAAPASSVTAMRSV